MAREKFFCMNTNQPLFLPKGSVRAILAIVTTTFVCTSLFYGVALPEWFVVTWAGIVGFYFIDKKHFNIDFNIFQSVIYTLQNYFLVGSTNLIPADQFAKHFLLSIQISGFLSISFLVYLQLQNGSISLCSTTTLLQLQHMF